MIPTVHGVRSAVKRENAERYVLISLVSFAASVVFTRLFLQVTGYPQLGNSELHIAHVLWGGLLLFIASLLPLTLANRWALRASAILSGTGVGLFIDEVGKFITQTNDYFYPPAAPIIYAFFLLTVLLYFRVRRQHASEPRGELYRIFEGLTEVLDHDLDPGERLALETRLAHLVKDSEDPNLKRLAYALIDYLKAEDLRVTQPRLPRLYNVRQRLHPPVQFVLSRRQLRLFLIVALGSMGVLAILEFGLLLWVIRDPIHGLEQMIAPLVSRGDIRSAQDALWFLVRVILEGLGGVALIVSGGLIVVRRERIGVQMATLVLVVWLTVINLLVFYLDQFSAVVTTLAQFIVLLAVTYYRDRYLRAPVPAAPPPPANMEQFGNISEE